MKILQEDVSILNVIKSYNGEYYDDYLRYDSRERFFWNLSCVKRYSLDWYPFEAESKVLVVGDKFGTIVGVACDKAARVDVLVDEDDYSSAILNRYDTRKNLQVCIRGMYEDNLSSNYDYAIIYLEDNWDYDWNNSYQIDSLLKIAKEHISDESIKHFHFLIFTFLFISKQY